MKKFKAALVIAATLLSAGFAHAQNWREGTNTVRGLIGMNRGQIDLGVDYERRMGTMGLGGFVLFSEENDHTLESKKPKQLVVAVNTPIHLIDKSPFDVYVAPGIVWINNGDEPSVGAVAGTGGGNESMFGPMLRFGTLYAINETWAAGLDFVQAYNWTNKDVTGEYHFANVSVAYNF